MQVGHRLDGRMLLQVRVLRAHHHTLAEQRLIDGRPVLLGHEHVGVC